jgi:hypothetical protein
MKKFTLAMAFLMMACTFVTTSFTRAVAQDVTVSYQTFYDELSPYGQWVYDAEYGNVFVPDVEQGFRPYGTAGRWVMTDNGNMWQSDYPWGWACFHYGRWTYNSYYGWMWIPGYDWAPAWVSWRTGGGYYGWAPMGPGYSHGRPYDYPENYWVFVHPDYLYSPNVFSYYDPGYQGAFIRRSRYYEEHEYREGHYFGPRRDMIERETHHPVEVYRVNSASSVGESRFGHGEVNVYRPAVSRERSNEARPSNVIRAERPVGRPENYSSEHRQNEFHQSVRQNDNRPENRDHNRSDNRDTRDYNRHDNNPRNQPDNHGRPEPNNQPNNQPQHQQPQPNNQPPPHQQPNNQPQHQQPQPNNQPPPHQQPNNQPQHQQPQPNNPAPQPRPQPQPPHNQPAPQPQHNQPPPVSPRPQPAPPPPTQNRPAPAPQQHAAPPPTQNKPAPAPPQRRPGQDPNTSKQK